MNIHECESPHSTIVGRLRSEAVEPHTTGLRRDLLLRRRAPPRHVREVLAGRAGPGVGRRGPTRTPGRCGRWRSRGPAGSRGASRGPRGPAGRRGSASSWCSHGRTGWRRAQADVSAGAVGVRRRGGVHGRRRRSGRGCRTARPPVQPSPVVEVAVAGAQVVAAAASAASSRSLGSLAPSPSPSVPQVSQVLGMNCIGPTAWSHSGSPWYDVVARRRADRGDGPVAVEGGARGSGGTEWPSAPRVRPPRVPCCDSTQPMPARVVHPRPQRARRRQLGAGVGAERGLGQARAGARCAAARPGRPAGRRAAAGAASAVGARAGDGRGRRARRVAVGRQVADRRAHVERLLHAGRRHAGERDERERRTAATARRGRSVTAVSLWASTTSRMLGRKYFFSVARHGGADVVVVEVVGDAVGLGEAGGGVAQRRRRVDQARRGGPADGVAVGVGTAPAALGVVGGDQDAGPPVSGSPGRAGPPCSSSSQAPVVGLVLDGLRRAGRRRSRDARSPRRAGRCAG